MDENAVKTVLVVEDDINIGRAIRDRLTNSGYNPVVRSSGGEALKYCEKAFAELILLDVLLPDMDGYALLAGMRLIPGWENVPVIVLSVTGAERSREEGVFAHIEKPFRGALLLQTVREALYGR